MTAKTESLSPEQAAIAQKRPQKRRKVTIADMEEVCRLIATRRLNETEAALKIGISQAQWFRFKARTKVRPQFDTILSRIRAESINACLTTIDEAGNPHTAVSRTGQTYQNPGDWRAKAWIAERVLAPERFGQQQAQVSVNSSVTIQLGGNDAVRQLVAQAAAEAMRQVSAPAEGQTKTLPEPRTTDAIDIQSSASSAGQ